MGAELNHGRQPRAERILDDALPQRQPALMQMRLIQEALAMREALVEKELHVLFDALRVMVLDFGLPAFRNPGSTKQGSSTGRMLVVS